MNSSIELSGLKIAAHIGTYKLGDTVPDAHYLDLKLTISPALVVISNDKMSSVFDYDPLIGEIDTLARDCHYETQERLMTRIAEVCARYNSIEAVDIFVYKTPVLGKTGKLGVRLCLVRAELDRIEMISHAD